MDSKTKIRIALILATAIHLFLLGYLLWIRIARMPGFEWKLWLKIVRMSEFKREIIMFDFGTIIVTEGRAFVAVAVSFAILVLPFIIYETGFFDNDSDELPDPDVEEGQTIEEAEKHLDRFAGFLKRRFGSIKKIKNYTLPIEITSAILGGFLITLPSIFLTDSELIWIPETEEWFVREYYGFIRGQLLLIGILLLVIGLILIIRYIRHRRNSANKEKLKPFTV